MDDASGLRAQLAPLDTALSAAAQRDAEASIAEAHERVEAIGKETDAKVRGIASSAAAEGDAAAARESAHRLVAAKRRGRRHVLEAQRAAYDALVEASLDALSRVREQPEYAALQERLALAATAVLGKDARLQRDPDDLGGLVAKSDGRSVNLTLPALVGRCVTGMGRDVSRLWE
jgi:vacuolar-type H+-ATPase subunit E/Vma4